MEYVTSAYTLYPSKYHILSSNTCRISLRYNNSIEGNYRTLVTVPYPFAYPFLTHSCLCTNTLSTGTSLPTTYPN